jgi:pimeloyl-ACP methyl ester carboxylesterase
MKEQIIEIAWDSINYKYYPAQSAKWDILILHGWGWKSDSWNSVAEILSKNNLNVYVPDLPGFWKSSLNKSYSIESYSDSIWEFIKELKLQDLILLWHSNWGAIATKTAIKEDISIKLLLLNNSAWVRKNLRRRLKRIILKPFALLFKLLSFLPFYSKFRSLAYRAIWSGDFVRSEKSNPNLKLTYLSVISADLTQSFNKISIPTHLIRWSNDRATPLSDGSYIRLNIHNSKMHVMEDEEHSIHLKNPLWLTKVILDCVNT